MITSRIFSSQLSDQANALLEALECDLGVVIGDVVRADEAGILQKASATALTTSNFLGIVEAKDSPTSCTVRVSGLSAPIFTALDVTKDYFLSATIAGGLSTSMPTQRGHVAIKVGQPLNSTQLIVVKGAATIRA